MMVALYPHVYSLSDQLQPYTNSVVLKLLGLQPRDMLVVNTIRKKKRIYMKMELSLQEIEILFLDHQHGCHDRIHCALPTSSKYFKA